MRWLVPVALVLSACGRIGFVGSADPSFDGPIDVPVDVAIDIAIDGGTQPVAVAGSDQVVPFVPGGTVISLDPSQSYDPNGTLIACIVDWTSGSSSGSGSCNTNLAQMIYLPGIYAVRLTVTDNDGLTATATKTITVIAPGHAPPLDGLVHFDAGPDLTTAAGAAVMFDFSASWNPDGFNYRTFGHDWGDGSSAGNSSNLISTYTYATAGTFTATYTLLNLTLPMPMWPVDTVIVTVN